MNYGFEVYHYGPFCSSVRDDVDWLIADEAVKDESPDKGRYSNYRPGDTYEELSSQFKTQLEAYQGTISTVADVFSDFTPAKLELLATIDFSYRWVKARGGAGPWRAATIEKFKDIKKEKFSDDEIETAHKALVGANLIEG